MSKAISTIPLVLAATVLSAVVINCSAATIVAVSCSQDSVQAAVNAAVDGDRVIIPDGSCSWSSGVSTTKQIRIEAQNYVPTPGGTTGRSVAITNNSTSSPLFRFRSGNEFHVGLAGIRFNEGSGDQNHVRFEGMGSKVPLVNDCVFEVRSRYGNQPDIAAVAWLSLGGVMWNSYFVGVGGGIGGQCCPSGGNIILKSPRAWATPSTMGSADINGSVNVYFEDSTFKNVGANPDTDDNGRLVIRHSLLDGANGLTHGFTSAYGGRHVEYYNNVFQVTTSNRNIAARYFWMRAGTGVFTDNTVHSTNQGWGTPVLLAIGDNTLPQPYPQPRQPGWGHNGSTHVSDPIYIWNQAGNGAYLWGVSDDWRDNVRIDRDIFVNSGPKPGYVKYTYPHPLRTGSSAPPNAPQAPANVRLVP